MKRRSRNQSGSAFLDSVGSLAYRGQAVRSGTQHGSVAEQRPEFGRLSSLDVRVMMVRGLSLLKLKDCKILNLLPSLLVPVLWFALKALFCASI